MATEGKKGDVEGLPAVLHVMVVGFHHQKGSTLEYVYPALQGADDHVTQSLTSLLPPEWRHLPHLALPDGSHNYENDSVYFTLSSPSPPASSVYGVACCRQIPAERLHHTDREVTRSTVQKSVCAICRFPAFKLLQSKLELVTHAYFNDADFTDISILQETYESMNSSITMTSSLNSLHFDLSQRALVLKYRHRLLQILKALLLHKKVLVFGSPANSVGLTVLAIVALLPLSLEQLCDRNLKADEYGFPLGVLDSGTSLRPYVCLQQMDSLSQHYSLAAVVNPLFEKQKSRVCDVFVHTEEGLVSVQDPNTRSQLHLTSADLRFCSHVTEAVLEHDEVDEPLTFYGSSEWIKMQYKLYIISLLASCENGNKISTDTFNSSFSTAWMEGKVFGNWKRERRDEIVRVEPCHPCEGDLSLGDIQRRLVARASDYGLNVQSREEVVQETQKVISAAAGRVSSAVSGAWVAASTALHSWWHREDQHGDTNS